jgi:membrane associated rhomboid family serine protease
MIILNKDPKDVPVCTSISICMLIIFLLFNYKVISSIPCGKNVYEITMSNFVHTDTAHLLSNLYALYAISRLEKEMGFIPFMWLLIFLISSNTIMELFVRSVCKNINCSIGFSGILFGLFTWELVSNNKLDIELLLAIVIMVVGPSLKSSNISLSGHILGAVTGIIGGVMWKFINK